VTGVNQKDGPTPPESGGGRVVPPEGKPESSSSSAADPDDVIPKHAIQPPVEAPNRAESSRPLGEGEAVDLHRGQERQEERVQELRRVFLPASISGLKDDLPRLTARQNQELPSSNPEETTHTHTHRGKGKAAGGAEQGE